MFKQDRIIPVSKINTTVGDLIEVISQVAGKTGKTLDEGRALAILTLEDLLRKNNITHIRMSAR